MLFNLKMIYLNFNQKMNEIISKINYIFVNNIIFYILLLLIEYKGYYSINNKNDYDLYIQILTKDLYYSFYITIIIISILVLCFYFIKDIKILYVIILISFIILKNAFILYNNGIIIFLNYILCDYQTDKIYINIWMIINIIFNGSILGFICSFIFINIISCISMICKNILYFLKMKYKNTINTEEISIV